MKTYVNALLASLLVCTSSAFNTSIAQTTKQAETAKTIIDTNVYAEPFDDAKIVTKTKRDATVSVQQRRLSWIKIKSGSFEGWVKSTALRIQGANVLPTSALASQNTGRNTQGNQIITTAVRGVHGAKSNRYVAIISDNKINSSNASAASPSTINARDYFTQLWGANQSYEWFVDSSSAEQTQQIQALSATSFRKNADSLLIYINTPIAQKNDCSFDFAQSMPISANTAASSALSAWVNQIAQMSQQMAQTWVIIEPIQTQAACPVSTANNEAMTDLIASIDPLNSFAQDKTNITGLVAITPPAAAKTSTNTSSKKSAVVIKKAATKPPKLTQTKKIATHKISTPAKTAQINVAPVWMSYLTACKNASVDLNQSGLINQTELANCVSQQASLSSTPKLSFWQAGHGYFSPYQVLNLSPTPINLSLLENNTENTVQTAAQTRVLLSEILPITNQNNTNITQLNGDVISKKVSESALVYVWGISAQNELTLLFPNTQDSANQLDANSVFEWKLPSDVSATSYPTILVSWTKTPLDFSHLTAQPKDSYFVFNNTKNQFIIWLNLILNNQNELTQLR